MKRTVICCLAILGWNLSGMAQEAILYGLVADHKGVPMEGVHVKVLGEKNITSTDEKGKFRFAVPSGRMIIASFTFVGFDTINKTLHLPPGGKRKLKITLTERAFDIREISVIDDQIRNNPSMVFIPREVLESFPSISGGGVEAFLKVVGAASNNELSSQYSVRGGNFDENLVYVNDFEIYRPLLIRSGQQEGLSFINSDLVSNILFSSGGFQAKYGDKMSSVLDIRYKRPKEFKGSMSLSLLGGATHLEGTALETRLRYLLGIRHKTNQYVLNSLPTKGEYRPSFSDFQLLLGYDLSDKWELEYISNYSRNLFRFIPEDRTTTFGVINNALQLDVFFDGQETDRFESFTNGLAFVHKPKDNLRLKYMTSAFYTSEREGIDIIGEYWLGQIETDFSKDDFGKVKFGLGAGTEHNWTRNQLAALVSNVGHKGYYFKKNHYWQWGVKVQHEEIDDQLSEWLRIDSAGFSLPYSDTSVDLKEVLKTDIFLVSNRYSGYIQDTWTFHDSSRVSMTGGVRFSYWDVNQEFLASPRVQVSYDLPWERDLVLKASAGVYSQPPFYRELRNLDGEINRQVKGQKSYHFVVGADYQLTIWNRPFKYVTEIYYKLMRDLVPYEFDNVRIRYFGENLSNGYATGIDMRLHGEFVKDVESWASLSVLQTQEDIEGDFFYDADSNKVEAGYIPRPTDQRVNFGMFFQDYLRRNKNFKMHLNFLFGTGFPFGPPDHEKFRDTLRIPPYRRVDIGFSALLIDGKKEKPPLSPFRHLESLWASLEVFNVLGVKNTVSYLWVKDITNRVYAVPNFLTTRRVNLRLIAKF